MFNLQPVESIEKLKLLIKINSLDYCILSEDDVNNVNIVYSNSIPIAIIEFLSNFSFIQWFEVFPRFRNQGLGKQIINFILSDFEHYLASENKSFTIYATPLNKDVELFWKKCGFIMTNPPIMSRKLN